MRKSTSSLGKSQNVAEYAYRGMQQAEEAIKGVIHMLKNGSPRRHSLLRRYQESVDSIFGERIIKPPTVRAPSNSSISRLYDSVSSVASAISVRPKISLKPAPLQPRLSVKGSARNSAMSKSISNQSLPSNRNYFL